MFDAAPHDYVVMGINHIVNSFAPRMSRMSLLCGYIFSPLDAFANQVLAICT